MAKHKAGEGHGCLVHEEAGLTHWGLNGLSSHPAIVARPLTPHLQILLCDAVRASLHNTDHGMLIVDGLRRKLVDKVGAVVAHVVHLRRYRVRRKHSRHSGLEEIVQLVFIGIIGIKPG